jgi:ABC-2 type transport system ATP-binding protein
VDAQLEAYALATRAAQRTGTLSGGQRQRLALAAATLHEPELLFLDEPTSAVDPQSRREFWETLFELAARGTTILVSTHFMDEAERCHRLAILDRGRLVAEGPPRALVDAVDAAVVEVEAPDSRRARAALLDAAEVQAVAQLGTRLRVQVARVPDPVERVRGAHTRASVEGEARRVAANLEDVFVAATRRSPAEAA